MEPTKHPYKYLQRDSDFTTDKTYVAPTVYFEDTNTGVRIFRDYHPHEVKRRVLAAIRRQYKKLRSKGTDVTVGFINNDGTLLLEATTWKNFLKAFTSTWRQKV